MISLLEISEKIKDWGRLISAESKNLYLAILIITMSALSFGLGYLAAIEGSRIPVRIENIDFSSGGPLDGQGATSNINQTAVAGQALAGESSNNSNQVSISASGQYVGSKNSTKYHLPWCSGAQRIKDENKVWFSSKEEAKARGYTPASNCPGL